MADYIQSMLELARQAQEHAYVPYSNFKVGVCLRTADGSYFNGCNYENAAYASTQCAEASAIGNMITAGQQTITEVVVIGSSKTPCSPCGGCRQKLREFMALDAKVHFYNQTGEQHHTFELQQLLPDSFGPEKLK